MVVFGVAPVHMIECDLVTESKVMLDAWHYLYQKLAIGVRHVSLRNDIRVPVLALILFKRLGM